MSKFAVNMNRRFLIVGILCILFYLIAGITVRFGQSLLFLWPLLGAALIGRYFLWKRAWAAGKSAPFPRWLIWTVRVCILLALGVFLYVESFIISAALRPAPEGLDAIVILGARVQKDGPSGSLNERIEAALAYLEQNPDTVAVASGGQGSDEPMSEAQCIYDHLTAAGVDPQRIRLEDASTSTLENLTNSFAILGEEAKTVGIVTNDFHIYRAVAVGNTLGGYTLSGVPARSTVFGFVHYSMREFFALSVMILRGQLTL